MNGAEALERSGRGFRQRLVEVESDDWARPTPCDEWSVRDLVNHVVGGNFRYVMILAGEPADALFARVSETGWARIRSDRSMTGSVASPSRSPCQASSERQFATRSRAR